jgi:hypothetical protein
MQGISNLELICAEFEALDELQEQRKRIKKERKKQRKLMNKQTDPIKLSAAKIEELDVLNVTNKENIDDEKEIEKNYSNQVDTNKNDNNSNSFEIIDDKIDAQSDNKIINDNNEISCQCSSPFYSTLLNEIDDNNQDDSIVMITEEEKNEYYANKAMYLIERINRREMLKEKFQNLKMNSSLKIRPRNF